MEGNNYEAYIKLSSLFQALNEYKMNVKLQRASKTRFNLLENIKVWGFVVNISGELNGGYSGFNTNAIWLIKVSQHILCYIHFADEFTS